MTSPETCIEFREHGARIMIEGREIEHYAIHVDPAKKEVSCWIASEANKKFSVVWLKLDSDIKCTFGGKLFLDGQITSHIGRLNHTRPVIFEHCRVSESSCVPFHFSPLVVTDDDACLGTSASHSIGEIKLVISRVTVGNTESQLTYFVPPHLQKVHERSKKAIAHRVGYGSIEIRKPDICYSTKRDETLVTFIFKYRPLEMLRANDIVPRNPEPPKPQEHALETPPTSETVTSSGKGECSTKVKRDVESGSEFDDEDSLSIREKALLDEVQRCQDEAQRFQAEVERIRNLKGQGRHLKDDSERPKKKLKKEEKPLFTPGEIIDLT